MAAAWNRRPGDRRRLRRLPGGEDAIIILVTVKNGPEDLAKVLEAGADDYIPKPLDVDHLMIRLTIAEQRVADRSRRREADDRLAAALGEARARRDDLLTILDRLPEGTVLVDGDGRTGFISRAARVALELPLDRELRVPFAEALRIDGDQERDLTHACDLPSDQRTATNLMLDLASGRRLWLRVEVVDDPRKSSARILFLHDVSEAESLRERLRTGARYHRLVGRSPAMLAIYQLIEDLAAVDTTVLIEGETGTGKELVARALHEASPRKEKAFVAVNLAGLAESLVASQLFGHKRGAFTGAIADHKGVFEAAHGGTLFLDEVGDIPPTVQTSLLRVLQEREVTRVGENTPRPVDVRLIAATHRKLADEVDRGAFRSDLLYRLRVARVALPPVRERREDIPLLVETFMQEVGAAMGKQVRRVDPEATRVLTDHNWPGNVRELRSAIEFAIVRARGDAIEPADLPVEIREPRVALCPVSSVSSVSSVPAAAAASVGSAVPVTTATGAAVADSDALIGPQRLDRAAVAEALRRAKGNRTRAAELLGVGRATLYRHLSRFADDDAGSGA